MISSRSKLEPIITLARRAGDAILELYGRAGDPGGIELKDDETPLTKADQTAHRIITMGLSRITPDIPVISEEGDPPDPALLRASEVRWLVDPLDGTKEFIKRSGEFTVNIALVRGERPVVGVVHAPVKASTWIAVGGRAWRRDRRGDDSILRVRPADTDNLVLAVSRDHSGRKVARMKRRLKGSTTRAMGSSLKFCLVAQGEADLYLRDGRTMEWDTAAAQAVLEAAGGGVYTLDGQPLGYGKPKLENPKFLAVGDRSVDWLALI
jgi:3'(2'), 5'-bisphosphate nucleotidase